MKRRRQEATPRRNAAATVYADAEFPHLTEDQADIMVAQQRMDGPERPFEEYLRERGYDVVTGDKLTKRI